MNPINRRSLLKLFGSVAVLGTPFLSRLARALENPRYVLIYESSRESYRNLLARSGVNPAQVTCWELRADREKIRRFVSQYGPNTQTFSWPILVAVPEMPGAEVEYWDLTWLNARRENFSDACYPISGSWWSVDGDWHPTKEKVADHLFTSPNHTGGKFEDSWLELLALEELQSLHSDHHREMTHQGKVAWTHVNQECPSP